MEIVDRSESGLMLNTAKPRLWIARALTIALPGLGHLYAGQPKAALALIVCFLLGGVGFFAVCLVPGVIYPRILVLFVLYYCVLVATAWVGVAHLGRETVASVRRLNAWVYVGTWVVGVLVPAGIGISVGQVLWGAVVVHDYGYYPQAVPGDQILFRRGDYSEQTFRRGELVVFETTVGIPILGRVVGLPGEVVWVESDGGLVIDEQPVGRRAVGRLSVTDPALDIPARKQLRVFRETMMDQPFEMFVDERAAMRPTDPLLIPDQAYFVLADHRTAVDAVDSRTLGAVSSSKITGIPLYISASWDSDNGAVRLRRIGFVLR